MMEQISFQTLQVSSLLSGDPSKSLEDARAILKHLRIQTMPQCTTNFEEMRNRDIAWHTLFSADIYLSFQQRKQARKAPSPHPGVSKWQGPHESPRGKCI